MSTTPLPLTAFKECDLRGENQRDVTPELAYRLGRAMGTISPIKRAVIGGDFRLSTPELLASLEQGFIESGLHVVNLGQLSTPGYYFARRKLGIDTGVMVTASHSPPEWNGFKPAVGHYPITPTEIENLKHIVANQEFSNGTGSRESLNILPDYVAWLTQRFAGIGQRASKLVFDCGGGATGWVISAVVDSLHIPAGILFGTPDPHFTQRSPDISGPKDLASLQSEVPKQGAQAGFGFDGDGDRVGLVDERGQRVSSDRLIAWLAGELLQRNESSAVIYDLKLSRLVAEMVSAHKGTPIPQKSGHTFIKTSMLQHDAIMGGEYSGHLFYRELAGGDDGLYSALLMTQLMQEYKQPISELIARMPIYTSTPDIRIHYTGDKSPLIHKAAQQAEQDGATLVTIDGVKAEYAEGWALMRASVTEAAFTLRFEGRTTADMISVAERFLKGAPDIAEGVMAQIRRHIE